jgi:hypothetical protein
MQEFSDDLENLTHKAVVVGNICGNRATLAQAGVHA